MNQDHPALAPFTKALPGRFAIYFILFLTAFPTIGYVCWAMDEDRLIPSVKILKQGPHDQLEIVPGEMSPDGPQHRVNRSGFKGACGAALFTGLVVVMSELVIRRRNRTNPTAHLHLT